MPRERLRINGLGEDERMPRIRLPAQETQQVLPANKAGE